VGFFVWVGFYAVAVRTGREARAPQPQMEM
jgi:hypothetical protein